MPPGVVLRCRRETGECSRRDSMNEHRTDYRRGGNDSDERNQRTIPDVKDSYVRSVCDRPERPLHVHALRYTPDVAKTDRRRANVDSHLGQPPRRPTQRTKCPVRRHLHQPASVGRPHPKADVTVMRKVAGPMLNATRNVKNGAPWCANQSLVDHFHRFSEWHWSQLVRVTQSGSRAHIRGTQLAVTLNMGRRETRGRSPTASCARSASSTGRKPRRTDTTPSCLLTG